jgi:hypothetical protein
MSLQWDGMRKNTRRVVYRFNAALANRGELVSYFESIA